MNIRDERDEEIQIHQEYEKVFGAPQKKRLLGDDYENSIRQEIIHAPFYICKNKHLPFEDVKLPTFREFMISKIIRENKNKHLFYIKQKGHYDAVGFLNKFDRLFTILRYSQIEYTERFSMLEEDLKRTRQTYVRYRTVMTDGELYLKKDLSMIDPEFSVCMVLGRKAALEEWKDVEGKTLIDCYPEIFNIKPRDEEKKESHKGFNILKAIETYKKRKLLEGRLYENVLFYIKRGQIAGRICDAMGFYNPENKTFTIKEGSLLALIPVESNNKIIDTDRNMFLSINCSKLSYGYVMRRDAVCTSPSIAASYVIGSQVNGWDYWVDKSGKTLNDVYRKDFLWEG